jgi:hypothetical protein
MDHSAIGDQLRMNDVGQKDKRLVGGGAYGRYQVLYLVLSVPSTWYLVLVQ